jgi:hypothetical protein
MEVTIPIADELDAVLKAGPCGDLAFIIGSNGQPMTKESFGNAFSDACRKAGIRKSAHGLRKLAAMRVALAGGTIPQMNAIFGWTGSKMAMHYIDMADRAQLARDGMKKLRSSSSNNEKAAAGISERATLNLSVPKSACSSGLMARRRSKLQCAW